MKLSKGRLNARFVSDKWRLATGGGSTTRLHYSARHRRSDFSYRSRRGRHEHRQIPEQQIFFLVLKLLLLFWVLNVQ